MSAGDVPQLTNVAAQVPAELADRLKALADRNERSASAELRIALRAHLDRAEKEAA